MVGEESRNEQEQRRLERQPPRRGGQTDESRKRFHAAGPPRPVAGDCASHGTSARERMTCRVVVPLPIRESELLDFTPHGWALLDRGGVETRDLPPQRMREFVALECRLEPEPSKPERFSGPC